MICEIFKILVKVKKNVERVEICKISVATLACA